MKINDIALKISDFTIGYNGKFIFDNLSLEVPSGVRCAIVGLNGSGKTTLLKGILNLEKKIRGDVLFFGENLNKISDYIAYVPQIKTIDWSFPITVENVVKMGCCRMNNFFSHTLSKNWLSKTHDALKKMNLFTKKDNHINDLSGGEKQRVFIARSIVQEPDLYILDEPLTGLDILSEQIITQLFKDITNENKTIIAVHHDLYTLYDYFNWIVIVHKGVLYNGILDKEIVQSYIQEAFSRYS